MAAMFIVAAGMLIGSVTILVNAYQESKKNAEARVQPPIVNPNEKEQNEPKGPSFGEAFGIARSNPWFWWTLCNGVMLAGLGLFYAVRKPATAEPEEQNREDRLWGKLGFFVICSVVSFFTVASLALPYTWIKSSDILTREGWKTQEPWLVILAYVLGLGGMFISLLAVKSEERSHVNIRRWIYGYNAFLGGLLFLAIVAVVNAWLALYGPEVSDWTATNIYSLSPATKRLVKSLDKPVRAYVILSPGTEIYQDVMNLLRNCRSVSDQIEIHQLSPEANFREVDQLLTKYNVTQRDPSGLAPGVLIVQDPDGPQQMTAFLKPEDIEEVSEFRGETPRHTFKGEQSLYAALRDFRENKRKATIYFSQDSQELSIDETLLRGRGSSPLVRSAVKLKQQMEKAGYEVKPLGLVQRDPNSKLPPGVPDDAAAVIVADPLSMSAEKAAALEKYMNRPKKEGVDLGKLIVLLDVNFESSGKIPATGLENFLAGYGIQAEPGEIFRLAEDPTKIPIREIPPQADDELAESVVGMMNAQRKRIEFTECRALRVLPGNPRFDSKPFLIPARVATNAGLLRASWIEPNRIADSPKYVEQLAQNPPELMKKINANQEICIAATVRDPGMSPPQQNPLQRPPPGKPGAPRMLVIGDATCITDAEMEKNDMGGNLIVTTLAWLRGKPELGADAPPPKERKSYRLTIPEDTMRRVFWLPLLWLLLAVIATGIGVGILRRR
jgi:hypothetical protein